MRKRSRPYLVTGAAISREQEFRSRRRRYVLTMAARVVLLVAAAMIARYSMVAAFVVGVASAVLPWIAVVMANDGPPKSSKYFQRYSAAPANDRAIEAPKGDNGPRMIVAETVIIDENGATLRPEDERGKHEQQ